MAGISPLEVTVFHEVLSEREINFLIGKMEEKHKVKKSWVLYTCSGKLK